MNIQIRFILIFLFIIFQSAQLKASHIMGGEITWECLGSGEYVFNVKVYRDCEGVSLPGNGHQIEIHNYPTIGQKRSFSLYRSSLLDISPACLNSPCDPDRRSPKTPGAVEEHTFKTQPIQLTGEPPSSGWVITWTSYARNAGITNLVSPSSKGITLRAVMHSYLGKDAYPCYDNCPNFFIKPASFSCTEEKFIFNHSSYDKELDSLSYEWAHPLDGYGGGSTSATIPGIFEEGVNPPILSFDSYNGYNYTHPFPGTSSDSRNLPATLDPITGEVTLTSFTAGMFVSVIKVKAYKCGELVAEIYRELQTQIIQGCSANKVPEMSSPSSAVTYHDTVTAGSLVELNIRIQDSLRSGNPNNDTIQIMAYGQQFGNNFTDPNNGCLNPPCATLSQSLPRTAEGSYSTHFKWQTDCNHIAKSDGSCYTSKNTYLFTFEAYDNLCPTPGLSVNTIAITVISDTAVKHPEIYCAKIQGDGKIELNWEKSPDPDSIFEKWMIYSADNRSGPYQLIDSISEYDSTRYVDYHAQADTQSVHYIVRAKSGCADNWKYSPADTISSIFFNSTFNGNCILLKWNSTKDLPYNALTRFDIYREHPMGTGFQLIKSIHPELNSYCDTLIYCEDDTAAYKLVLRGYGGCESNSNSDSVTLISVVPPAIADAGNDIRHCGSDSVQIGVNTIDTNYTYAWTPGRYLNDSTLASPMAFSKDTTVYKLTVTNQVGCTNTDSMRLIVESKTIANAGNDTSICSSNLPIKLNGRINNNGKGRWLGGNGTFSPSRNTLNASYLPSPTEIINGKVKLSLITTSNDICDTDTSEINITILKFMDNITLNIDSISCYGVKDGAAWLTINGNHGPYTQSWIFNSQQLTTDTISNLGIGNYLVTITNKLGCDTTIHFTLNQPDELSTTLNIVNNVSCHGGEDAAISSTVSGGRTPYSYQWSNNSTNPNINHLNAGKYKVVITDYLNCIDSSSITVSQPDSLEFAIHTTDLLCYNDSNGSATIIINKGGTPPFTYLWSNGSIDSTAKDLKVGVHSVTITDKMGCIYQDTIEIKEPQPLSSSISGTNISCYGEKDGEAKVRVMGGTTPYTYKWSNNNTTEKATALPAGSHTVITTDSNGCKDTNSYTVTEPDSISLYITKPDTICVNTSKQLEAHASGGYQPYNYHWNHNLGNSSIVEITPTESKLYQVTVSDSNNCPSVTKSVFITVMDIQKAHLKLSSTGRICERDSALITTHFDGNFEPYTYSWNTNLTGIEDHYVSPDQTTDYSLTITDQCGNSISDTTKIIVLPKANINLNDTLIEGCRDLLVPFDNHTSRDYDYKWDFGDGNTSEKATPEHLYTKAGEYKVGLTVSVNEGCVNKLTKDYIIKVNPTPLADIKAKPIETTIDTPDVTFYDNFSDASYWEWNMGDGNTNQNIKEVFHTYKDTGTFRASLIKYNDFGCSDTAYIDIIIHPDFMIKIPTAFTPNPHSENDGKYNKEYPNNEVFFPFVDYTKEYDLLIFNRWGELIFKSKDVAIGWNGYYKGKLSPSGTYVYKLNVTFLNGKKVEKIGNITLLR